jgi:hypothetical protein
MHEYTPSTTPFPLTHDSRLYYITYPGHETQHRSSTPCISSRYPVEMPRLLSYFQSHQTFPPMSLGRPSISMDPAIVAIHATLVSRFALSAGIMTLLPKAFSIVLRISPGITIRSPYIFTSAHPTRPIARNHQPHIAGDPNSIFCQPKPF